MARNDLTAEYVRQILDYNPETGEFRWKQRTPEMFYGGGRNGAERSCATWNARYAGDLTGCIKPTGYLCLRINDRLYQSHRIAWLYMTGAWPKEHIDHIDGDGTNNSFANLREATNSENMRNRGATSHNASGVKGVCWDRQRRKWVAQITLRRSHIYLGRFDAIEDAAAAYERAARDLHGEFARTE